MVLDHLAHGINDRDDPRLLYSTYLHFLDEYTRRRLHNRTPTVFVIGGGALTLPRAWVQDIPAEDPRRRDRPGRDRRRAGAHVGTARRRH